MQKRVEAAKAEFATEKAKCFATWPARQGNYLRRVECENAAFERIARPLVPNPDLYELAWAYDLALAAKMDRGDISREDARLQRAQFLAQLSTEAQNRVNAAQVANAQAQMAQAQQSAAFGNVLAGFVALQQASRPSIINTTCNRIGGFSSCTSY
jgi:hypothetical protein